MKVIAALLLAVIGLKTIAQESSAIGSVFPELEAESNEKAYKLPDDTKGKYSLIGLTYNQKSAEALQEWMQPIYGELIEAHYPNINVFFVMMFGGAAALAENKIRAEIEESIDPVLHPHLLFYSGGLKKYQSILDMLGRKDTSYYFVLDQNGEILWATRGRYREAKMDKIKKLMMLN